LTINIPFELPKTRTESETENVVMKKISLKHGNGIFELGKIIKRNTNIFKKKGI
jgi:hypothetical protein